MIALSDDPARLQFERVHAWLAGSYWSPGIDRETVERAARRSHCLGAYDAAGEQVGDARMISDRATFAWLADVWVVEARRGAGLGRLMVRWFLDHPDYADIRRFALATKDAHGVYATLGFRPLLRPEGFMERLSSAYEDLLRGRT